MGDSPQAPAEGRVQAQLPSLCKEALNSGTDANSHIMGTVFEVFFLLLQRNILLTMTLNLLLRFPASRPQGAAARP